ncbi:hypothetical protein H6P81_009655 [Aristolochia fimbriata]|uniref:J domain-containing protein n=1 Tax=Aristolochia fimbriata TaxID=158543 RepID=A0AAV7ELK3_ARIFI|nr:hypothetical protein H6P81_009655 [Aristolochia fimbriata]
MADFQQSLFTKRKVSNGNAYDDVFGGPPKYSVPSLPSRVDDYSEIFGNFFAPRTSSIPLLDFPLLDEDQACLDVPDSKFDYTQVFGAFDAADFAVPYEELFSERQAQQHPSTNSWSHIEEATQQVPEVVSTAPLEQDDQGFFTSLKAKQSFSNGTSEHLYNGSKQFSVSYNKSNQGGKREPLSGTTHIAHLHDVSGFSVLIDSCLPTNDNKYESSVAPKHDLSPKGDSNVESIEEHHFREISSDILGSDEVEKMSDNEIKPDEKHLYTKQIDEEDALDSGNTDTDCFSNQMPSVQKASLKQIHLQDNAVEGATAGDQHTSCNPVPDLPPVGDNPFEKVVFLTISDINLRTQPSQLPPPSRPPPKLVNSTKLNASRSEVYSRRPMKTTETYHFGSSFDTYTLQDNDASPPFFDVEVDASSAAAAAMREAMEKAQAKLKSAKESMERKKDGYQGRMKLNLYEDKNIKEQRMSKTTRDNHTLKDEEALDSCARWSSDFKHFARVDRWKMMSTADIASDYERKMDLTEVTAASKDKWHGKNFTGSHEALHQEKRASDWKVEKQYYELINNEKAFKLAADQENYEMNLETVGWNPMGVSIKEEDILEKNEKFKAFNEPYLQEDRDQKPKGGKTACKLEDNGNVTRPYAQDREIEKNEKNFQTSQEDLKQSVRWKVDKMVRGHNDYDYGTNIGCGKEKGEKGLKQAFEHEKEKKRQEVAHDCVADENRQKVAHMHKGEEQSLKATYEHEEKEKGLKATREQEEEKSLEAACKREEEEKSLEAACKPEEEEKRLKAVSGREEEDKRLKAACGREVVRRLKGACEHKVEEKRLKVASEYEEVEKRPKSACEHEKEERRVKADRKCEEQGNGLKAAWELEAEEKKLKAPLECGEEEKRPKAACERDDEVMRLKASSELEEEKKLEVTRKLEDEKQRLESAFAYKEKKMFNAAWVQHVQEEKGPKETHECQEDGLKYTFEAEEEHKSSTVVHVEEENRLKANCAKRLESDTVKTSLGCEVQEKIKEDNQSEKERLNYEPEEDNNSKRVYDVCDTKRYGKNSKETKDTCKQGIDSKLVEVVEWEVNGAELKPLHTGEENEEDEKKKPTVGQQEENEKLMTMSKTGHGCDVNEKQGRGNEKQKEVQDIGLIENRNRCAVDTSLLEDKTNGRGLDESRVGGGHDGNATMLKAAYKDLEGKETGNKQAITCEEVENMKEGVSIPLWSGEGKISKVIHDAHKQTDNAKARKTDQATMKQEKNDDKQKGVREANGLMKNQNSVDECMISLDKDKGSNSLTAGREIINEAENRTRETVQFDCSTNGGEKIVKTPQLAQDRGREEKVMDKTCDRVEREKEERLSRERELEKERLRKLEEEREREREREKDRLAVERATREARERAATEARERAERAAVERALAEARQRALADARERAERASLAEKASNEAARLKAERAAVERATAEARERAAEKAAERAAERTAARDKTDGALRQNQAPDIQVFRGTQGDSALRCKARLERHQRTVERAAKALAEKNLRDVLVQREQAERNRLAETLDADIRRWANGKEGNLRALLSTLQYILGPESGWQPIPLTDVITAVAVKRAYRKATLCVHPDKLQQRGATIQQKYICEKVFDLLKEAWNRFNSEER